MESNTKQYDETNRGVLFNISEDWSLTQQGKININGESLRVIGVKRLNKEGKEIIELYRAMGTLKKAEKNGEKDPDAKGVINALVDKGAMIISAWKENSERGNKYISLRLREFSNDGQSQNKQNFDQSQQTSSSEQIDDKIEDIDLW
jgi:hypothetical protein|tara:strand:+ start:3236 stop:3676 length:441 start_codon:yes stop_codon:yes gene_type:complete